MNKYDLLEPTSAIGSYKRDILLEAADDLWYLSHILSFFKEEARLPEKESLQDAIRLIRELMNLRLVEIATWGEQGKHRVVKVSDNELLQALKAIDKNPFDLFLIVTEAGLDWVKRYKELIAELSMDRLKMDQA